MEVEARFPDDQSQSGASSACAVDPQGQWEMEDTSEGCLLSLPLSFEIKRNPHLCNSCSQTCNCYHKQKWSEQRHTGSMPEKCSKCTVCDVSTTQGSVQGIGCMWIVGTALYKYGKNMDLSISMCVTLYCTLLATTNIEKCASLLSPHKYFLRNYQFPFLKSQRECLIVTVAWTAADLGSRCGLLEDHILFVWCRSCTIVSFAIMSQLLAELKITGCKVSSV